MNLDVAIRTVRILRVLIMLRASGLVRAYTVRHAVARQAKLSDTIRNQQARVRRTMRCVTGSAAFCLDRRMLVNKRTLLIDVTLYTGGVGPRSQSRLFEFKPTVRIVTIAALHGAFEHLVMERQIELVLGLAVAVQTELRLAVPEQLNTRDTGLLRVCS